MRIDSPFLSQRPLQTSTTVKINERKNNRLKLAAEFLTRHYGWIIFTIGAVIIVLETVEHLYSIKNHGLIYLGEILLIVLLLSITGFLTQMLLNSLAERSQAVNTLRMKHNLGMQLFAGQDLSEVSRRLVQQITPILSLESTRLFLFDKTKGWFVLVDSFPKNEPAAPKKKDDFLNGIDPFPCRQCFAKNKMELRSIQSCKQSDAIRYIQTRHGYCLPLFQGGSQVGLLQIFAPDHKDLTTTQVELLENLSVEMFSSLHTAMEKKEREEEMLTQKIRIVQLDIARDLHDTIGQNISYLRMKLDHLSSTNLQTKTDMAADIEQMSGVANESYDLVRGTLAVLQTASSGDLLHLFSRYAEQVSERSTFKIDFTSHGKQKTLSSHRMRQLFFIFREALSNIEKHANASQVFVEMCWEDANLTMIVSDNGQGFDPAHLQYTGHYGLKFMRERTDQMNGSLSILSTKDTGTNIVVHLPYE